MINLKKVKRFDLLVWIAILVLAGVSVGVGCIGFFNAKSTVTAVFLLVLSALILILDILLVYLLYIMKEDRKNYFLYDSRQGKNIPISQLSFNDINSKLELYISRICPTSISIWTGEYFNESFISGDRKNYSIPIAYKMLYDLVAPSNEDNIIVFWKSPEITINFVCNAIAKNGDSDMASKLVYLRKKCVGDIEKLKVFLSGNSRYIQGRMIKYIRENINKFYK